METTKERIKEFEARAIEINGSNKEEKNKNKK